jgi:hypothetical protein
MLKGIDIQAGDYFCVEGRGFAAAGIRAVQRFNSFDNEATYGHSAIIMSGETGMVLDTRWTVKYTNLSDYAGQKILIARPNFTVAPGEPPRAISESDKRLAIKALALKDFGAIYPVHRIILHLIPPISKFLWAGWMKVCSERTAAYLQAIQARPFRVPGTTPDMLADEARHWKNIDVIFEGVLP